jgi:IS5 family transposase
MPIVNIILLVFTLMYGYTVKDRARFGGLFHVTQKAAKLATCHILLGRLNAL